MPVSEHKIKYAVYKHSYPYACNFNVKQNQTF